MTAIVTRVGAVLAAVGQRQWVMWIGFILLHGALSMLARFGSLGDVLVYYRPWSVAAVAYGNWPGIDTPWVYPVVAILPMLAPLVLGYTNYVLGWMLLVQLLNAAAFFLLLRQQRAIGTWVAGWWWLLFMGLLGSLSLTRLDSVVVPLSIAGLLFAVLYPTAAGILLSLATWIKVWPVFVLGAVFLGEPRWRLLRPGVIISIVVLVVALMFGTGLNVLSFASSQGTRGIEVGSPLATAWLWAAFAGNPETTVFYNDGIEAFEVYGPFSVEASTLLTGVLVLAVAAVVVLIVLAKRAGAGLAELVTVGSLALITANIVFNKVGSPQYMSMLIAPIVVALALGQRRFALPAMLAAVAAGLTQVVFPWFFDELLATEPLLLLVIGMRNVVVALLFAWSVRALWQLRARHAAEPELANVPAVWPFRA